MDKTQTFTVELDAETAADLNRLAEHLGEPLGRLLATAVLRFVADETEPLEERLPKPPRFAELHPELAPLDAAADAMEAFVRKGIDAADAGELIPHDEVMRGLEARLRSRRAA